MKKENPIRVLMIAPQPFFQPRGTPFSVLHRLKALSKLGYKIDLLTYHLGEDVSIDGVTIHRISKVPFVKRIAIGPSKRKIILDLYLIAKTIQMLKRGNYDLIHSHEEAGFFAAYLCKRYGVMHLYDMHSSLPQQLSNFKFSKSKLLRAVFENLENYTIESAAAVITICPELHNYVRDIFPEKHNVLIENVADNSLVFNKNSQKDLVDARLRTNGDRIVLYAGTFEPYQGIDLLIDSSKTILEKEKHVKFVLVGGKPEQVEKYKAKVDGYNLSEHYTFTGSVLPEDVPDYIAACDILVSPRIEGNNTPLKIYSYLRSGKPIVATKHITHTQVLSDDVSMLTDCTPDAFGEGVLRVIRDKDYGDRLARNARELAEAQYSYEVYLQKTEKLYQYLESQLRKQEEK